MSTRSSAITVAAVPSRRECVRVIKRESRRDFAGVAVGVAIGALLWFVMLSLAQIFG